MRIFYFLLFIFLLSACHNELETVDDSSVDGYELSSSAKINVPFSNCFSLFSIKNVNLIKLPEEESKDAIWEAFENWQDTSLGVFFREIEGNEEADIEINFGNDPQIFPQRNTVGGLFKIPFGGNLSEIRFSKQKPTVTLWLNSSFNWNRLQLNAVVSFLIGRAYGLEMSDNKLSIMQNNLSAITLIQKPSTADIESFRTMIARKCTQQANLTLKITPQIDYIDYISTFELMNWNKEVVITHGVIFAKNSKLPTLKKNDFNIVLNKYYTFSGLSPLRLLTIASFDSLKTKATYGVRSYFFNSDGLKIYGARSVFKTQ